MKKVKVYYTEINRRLEERKCRVKTVEVQEKMYDTWDWDGIERTFRAKIKGYCQSDSTIKVNKIKVGRAILQG